MPSSDRPLLLQNFRARVVALLLAIITWYVVYGAISHEHQVADVPVTISLSSGWAVLDRSVDTVSIRFRGSREDIRSLEAHTVQVILDMRGEEFEGTRTLDLRLQDVKAPGSARPLRIRPDKLAVTLDRESEKSVPVKAHLTGELPPGVEMSAVVPRPAAVFINGPQSLLDGIQEIRTVPIDLKRRVKSFEERVGLTPPDTARTIRMEPSSVMVEMKLIQRKVDVAFEDVPLKVLKKPGQPQRVELSPLIVSVSLEGDPADLADLQKSQILAYVDCSEVEAGASYELPIRIHGPARLNVSTVNPPVVSASVHSLSISD